MGTFSVPSYNAEAFFVSYSFLFVDKCGDMF